MTRETIFAWTAPGSTFPQFVNVKGGEGDTIKMMVREHAVPIHGENGGHYAAGHTVDVEMHRDEAVELAFAILKNFSGGIIQEDGRTIIEHTEAVGEVSSTRRIIVETAFGEPLHTQVARLASTILEEFDSEPSEDAGAVDTAIRLLRGYARLIRDSRYALLHTPRLKWHGGNEATQKISAGLRAGQAERVEGETADETLTTQFVDAGTKAVPVPEEKIIAAMRKTFDANHEEHCGAGDHGFDVPQPAPFVRDSDLVRPVEPCLGTPQPFEPAGGRDPGDENPEPVGRVHYAPTLADPSVNAKRDPDDEIPF